MNITAFLKLIRYKNLLVYALCLVLVRTNIIDIFYAANGKEASVSMGYYMIFVLVVILALAGFYIINDFNDQQIDDVNRLDKNIVVGNTIKPETAKKLYRVCLYLSFVAFLAFVIPAKPFAIFIGLVVIFIGLLGTTYNKVKKVLLGKNIFMALVPVALVLFPVVMEYEYVRGDFWDKFVSVLPVVVWLAVVLALVQFIRETVKDVQDREGDKQFGVKTLIISCGEKKTKRLVYLLTALLMALVLAFQIIYLSINPVAVALGITVLVHFPLIYFLVELRKAQKVQDYGFLADLLSMIFISVLFVTFLARSVIVWQLAATAA
ncbi:MAG: UbiA family prenyltransferase [Bacteroidales bacterium]|jgi:4-hydroxybenzoate polyprenyltransferase|nr:UbiA family prenyltransferase [Bacteroidales bacterium]